MPSRLVTALLYWVLISAMYYVGRLFSGELSSGYDQFLLHKGFKYVAATCFSLLFLFYGRNPLASLFVLSGILLLVALCIVEPASLRHIDVLLVLMSMGGLVAVLNALSVAQRQLLEGAAVVSAGLVGVVAINEWQFLPTLYADYWNLPGSTRLIGSLYNPNNMGLYQGACTLLLLSSRLPIRFKLLMAPLILFALVMSGSRTAWLALVVVAGIALLPHLGRVRLNRRALGVLIGLGGFLLLVLLAGLVSGKFGIPERLTDYQSALIRLERYSDFLLNANVEYLFPDLQDERTHLVSESSYFAALNSLGLIGVALVMLCAVLLFAQRSEPTINSGWRLVFWFYLVAAIFENILNSFPNNQMLFISAGAYFVVRKNSSPGATKR